MVSFFGAFVAVMLTLLQAKVATYFWVWFLIPLNFPPIAYLHMLGLFVFGRYIVNCFSFNNTFVDVSKIEYKSKIYKKEGINTETNDVMTFLFTYLVKFFAVFVSFGLGALVHWLM